MAHPSRRKNIIYKLSPSCTRGDGLSPTYSRYGRDSLAGVAYRIDYV
jgi:hypothetical protein